jgi:hypothetical protein
MTAVSTTASNTSVTRKRAPHTKSRAGCLSCKYAAPLRQTRLSIEWSRVFFRAFPAVLTSHHRQRRIKCDQTRPACTHCIKADWSCYYNLPAPPVHRFRGFKHSVYSSESNKDNVTVDDYSRNAVEYFCLKALPIWRGSHPSTLWDHVVASFMHPTSNLSQIAAAIGIQQRIVDRCSISTHTRNQSDILYTRAIKSLRHSISDSGDVDSHVLPCVLMVVLESLRGSTDRLLVHLRCGLRFLTEKTETGCQDTREAAKMLQQYAVRAVLSNPLSKDAQCIQAALTNLSGRELVAPMAEAACDPIFALSTSIIELLSLLEEYYRISPALVLAQTNPLAELPIQTRESLWCLEQQRQAIEKAIDAKLALAYGVHRTQTAVFNIAKACCVLVKVYLSSAWTGRQSSYDDQIDSFRDIVNLTTTTLELLKSGDGNEAVPDSTLFFVGFSLQTTLMMVFLNCRCPEIRKRVFALLDRCPDCEGSSEVAVVKAICHAISEFEDEAAGGKGISIPEDCRVHRYLILPSEQAPGTPHAVRLYFRPDEGSGFVSHNVRLVFTPRHTEQDIHLVRRH